MSDNETEVDLEEWSEIDVSGSNKETSTVEYEIKTMNQSKWIVTGKLTVTAYN